MAQTPDDETNAPAAAPPGPLEALAEEARGRAAHAALKATAEAAADAAIATAGKVASGVLDGLETLLFGRLGAAEEAAKADEGDPLARMRSRYNADVAAVKRAAGDEAPEEGGAPAAAPPQEAAPARPVKPDPVARARLELEALKAARDKRAASPDAPIKKTL
ncbi:MAG: hypothetical protein Q8P18_04455 [Pseudomonadota bacterium]|nr:hypothetical protein [Pseudomonadota bacterium]